MINVVVADDSLFLRRILKDVLESSRKIKVVGEAKNGKEAIALVASKKPDILILDCEMPVMNGLEALRNIMRDTPLPVFMFSSLTTEGASVTVKALEYGAIDFMPKPSTGAFGLEDVAEELIAKIEAVVKKEKRKSLFAPRFKTLEKKPKEAAPEKVLPSVKKKKLSNLDLLVIGSSTGGVKAAMEVLNVVKKENCPPVLWVQHMPPTFTTSLAKRADAQSEISVREAAEGDTLEKGVCLLAPGGKHMKLVKKGGSYSINVVEGTEVPGVRPSCDYLFDSVADFFGSRVLAVILTGMGADGAKGLLKIHKKGSYVLGQDEETCVVYGMPKAAYEAGAVDEQLPLGEIGYRINELKSR